MAETLRWSLEVALLVTLSFALGAGVMALVLRALLPDDHEPDAHEPDAHEPDAHGPARSAGVSS